MTPTLIGRWQTRVALLGTVGVAVTLLFAAAYGTFVPFVVLAYVALLGLGWDCLYSVIQSFRWERDWPPAFAVVAAVAEGLVVYLLATRIGLPGLPGDVPAGQFTAHYATVWVATYGFAQGPMRALFPWWRFHGGRVWPAVSRSQRR